MAALGARSHRLKQPKTDVLVDAHNVGLRTRTVLRWNPRDAWVSSGRLILRS
jgi:hypothetical protein